MTFPCFVINKWQLEWLNVIRCRWVRCRELVRGGWKRWQRLRIGAPWSRYLMMVAGIMNPFMHLFVLPNSCCSLGLCPSIYRFEAHESNTILVRMSELSNVRWFVSRWHCFPSPGKNKWRLGAEDATKTNPTTTVIGCSEHQPRLQWTQLLPGTLQSHHEQVSLRHSNPHKILPRGE